MGTMDTPKPKNLKSAPEQLSFFSTPQPVPPAAPASLNSATGSSAPSPLPQLLSPKGDDVECSLTEVSSPEGTLLPQAPPPQAAARSAGGFLYQIRYAAMKALELKPGQTIGIESIDDVDISGPNGQLIIQVKNEVTPLTDMNRGLWKALAHWAREIKSVAHTDDNVGALIFATTAPIHSGLPDLLSRDEVTLEDRKQYIIDKIGSSKDEKLDAWIQQVKELDSRRLGTLLSKVRIVAEGDAEKLLLTIKGILSFRSFRDEGLITVAQQFEGWIFQKSLSAFQSGHGARITEQDVRSRIQNIRDQQLPHRPHFRHRRTKIEPREIAAYRGCVFFRQLEEIGLDPVPIDDALMDYLRDQKERSDWAQTLEVGRAALTEYDGELFEAWKHKFLDVAGKRARLEEKQNGLELYDAVLDSVSPLLQGTPPPRHVYRGSYHRLADEPCIGWHPRWRELFSSTHSDDKNRSRQHDDDSDGMK